MNYYNLFRLFDSLNSISLEDIDLINEQERERFIELLEELQGKVQGVFPIESNKIDSTKE